MKYSLEKENRKSLNAGFKAVNDVTEIVHSLGYKPIVYGITHPNRLYRNVMTVFKMVCLLCKLQKSDICFLQWPLNSRSDILLYNILKWRCGHLQLLIHDLTSARFGKNQDVEKRFLIMAETIVAHTPAMKEFIMSMGVAGDRVRTLMCFDYLINDYRNVERTLTTNIAFAGNLEKSNFLKRLKSYDIGNISIFCYGKLCSNLERPLIYKGYFEPEVVSGIEGSWGLVWDGDTIDVCSGELGEYLRINSPHKASLYIVARLPLIVWSESAIAGYVKEKGIGICINSLLELSSKIANISREQYNQMLENIDKERYEIVNGVHLRRILN